MITNPCVSKEFLSFTFDATYRYVDFGSYILASVIIVLVLPVLLRFVASKKDGASAPRTTALKRIKLPGALGCSNNGASPPTNFATPVVGVAKQPINTPAVPPSCDNDERRTLKRRMTSIGRFALKSQTDEHQCVVAFFVCLANRRGTPAMDVSEFETMWRTRVMARHERFRSRVCVDDDRFFEVDEATGFEEYAYQTTHPSVYREDLQLRIEDMLTSSLDTYRRLWEGQISTGPLGSSGAISLEKVAELDRNEYDRETLILCRIHHALADGVSMGVALGDAADEAAELREKVLNEIERRKKIAMQRSLFEKFMLFLGKICFMLYGCMKALTLQLWRMATSNNPFKDIIANSDIPAGRRSTSWRHAAPVDEVRKIAKTISQKATVNDVFVSCVSAAISKQLEAHQLVHDGARKQKEELPSSVNVVVPVHLYGGVLLPGRSLGNSIGAFVTNVPAVMKNGDATAAKRLLRVSSSLSEGKSTPAHLISWSFAKFFSEVMPEPVTKIAMANGNAQSVAVVSNVRGFPFRVHWNGRPVVFLSAFLPLPPGIPIGIVVQSYAGEMSFTVDADERAVPDADRFADWMVEEYNRLKDEAATEVRDT